MDTFNQKLKCCIKERDVKQEYLAHKIGIAQNTMSKKLNGQIRITAEEFLYICHLLNLDPNLFMKYAVKSRQNPTKGDESI